MGYQVWLEGGGGAHGAGRKGGQVFPAEATVRRPTWEGSRRIGGTEPNPSFHDRRGPDATDGLQEGGRAGTTQTERIQMQLGFVLPIGSGAAPRWASGACPGLPVRGAGGGCCWQGSRGHMQLLGPWGPGMPLLPFCGLSSASSTPRFPNLPVPNQGPERVTGKELHQLPSI